MENSVTRFVEILPLWQNFKSLWGTFWMGYLAFGKLLYQLWNFYATGQIVIVVNSQRLNTNSVIWSHWWRSQKIRKEILAEFSFWLVKENCVTVQWHGAKAQTQETLFTFHLWKSKGEPIEWLHYGFFVYSQLPMTFCQKVSTIKLLSGGLPTYSDWIRFLYSKHADMSTWKNKQKLLL